MVVLATFATVLALLQCASAATNTAGDCACVHAMRNTVEFNIYIIGAASNCRYVRHFSFEGGNMTCPDSAPVLFALETIAP